MNGKTKYINRMRSYLHCRPKYKINSCLTPYQISKIQNEVSTKTVELTPAKAKLASAQLQLFNFFSADKQDFSS